jgi:hypothetical protein
VAESVPAAGSTYGGRPGRRRGRRPLVVLVVLLLVLAGLLLVTDRVVAGVAERVVADRVDRELTRRDVQFSAPEVTVGGFPFLTQVVGGRYDSIRIVLREVRASAVRGNVTVSAPEVTVEARGVSAPLDTLRSGRGDVTADTVRGTLTVAYDSVAKLIDQPGVRLAEEDGNLVVTAPIDVPLIGERLTVRGTARLTPDGDDIVVTFSELTSDDLPDDPAVRSFVTAFTERLTARVPLPPLPFGVAITEIRPRPEGLVVTGVARNVILNNMR